MSRDVYRYRFNRAAPMGDVRDSLHLAIFAAEGLHGRAQVRLDAGYHVDEEKRACVVDAAAPVGRTVAQVFTGLLTRQFGEDAFTVERVVEPPDHKPASQRGARRPHAA